MNVSVQKQSDVVVIGDGIAGRTIARGLAERGLSVDIVCSDRHNPATLAAAGLLSPLPESVSGSAFQLTCLEARDGWLTWAELLRQETSVDLGLCTKPSLFPAFNDEERQAVDALRRRAIAASEGVESLSGDQVYEFVPTLAPGAVSGLLLTDEARVDPAKVMEALAHSLEVHSVLTHRDRAVKEIRIGQDQIELIGDDWQLECGHVIVACGAWSAGIEGLGMQGIVRPVRGQMIAFKADHTWSGCIRRGRHYALTRGDEIVFGATEENAGYEDTTTEDAGLELRDCAEALLPKLTWRKTLRQWSGLRPGSVDALPIVGPWLSNRITIATGTFRNGILLAPWLGQVVGDLVQHGEAKNLPPELSTARFTESRP